MRWHPNTVYDIANRKYFGNRLPKYRVTFVADPKIWARVDYSKKHIYLCDTLRNKWKKTVGIPTLLHEMAHIENYMSGKRREHHGYCWEKIMRRLAAEGAFTGLW